MIGRRILVPLAGPAHARPALSLAHALSRVTGGTIHVLHIAEEVLPPHQALERLGLDVEDLGGAVLESRAGDPAAQILAASETMLEAPLIVLCTRGGQGQTGACLGPVSEHILGQSMAPLVFLHPERAPETWQLDHVLLAHDGTPSTTAAVVPASQLAGGGRGRLSVLHVAAPEEGEPLEPGSLPTPHYVDQRQHEWPEWAHEFLDRVRGATPEELSRLRLVLTRGEPGTQIVRFAREHGAGLIVLAWHGALEHEHAHIVKAVLRDAPCPIVVLRRGSLALQPRAEHGEHVPHPGMPG